MNFGMNRINRSIFEKSIALLLSAIFSVSIYLSLTGVLSRDFTNRLNEEAGIFLENVKSTNADVIKTLHSLNALEPSECDEELLKLLRKTLFDLRHVQDIGFFKGTKLVCSTGLGIVAPPVESTKPEFVGIRNVEIWVDPHLELFQKKKPSIVIRIKKFDAVLSRESLSDLVNIKYDWQLVFRRNNETTHLAGMEGLYNLVEKNPDIARSKFISNVCAKNQSYCIFVSASRSDFFTENKNEIYLISILSLIAFLFSNFTLNYFINRHHSTEYRVLRGLRNNCFYCHYQPIVKIDSEEIIGFEVLARYKDNLGEIYPDVFIPVITQRKKTWEFTKSIISKSVADLGKLKFNSDNLKININFFPQDIESTEILELVKLPIKFDQRIKLVIEITEDAQLGTQNSKITLEELVNFGFEIAIDDFGTGYSNFSQLIDFKCHTLKIDRSFISEMEEGSIRASLIPHIMNIAKQLNLNVVAEGVENIDQLRDLKELGVQFGQGYLFSRPVGIEKLPALMNQAK